MGRKLVEVNAILPFNIGRSQPRPGLMHKRGGLQCMAGALPTQILIGKAVQVAVNE